MISLFVSLDMKPKYSPDICMSPEGLLLPKLSKLSPEFSLEQYCCAPSFLHAKILIPGLPCAFPKRTLSSSIKGKTGACRCIAWSGINICRHLFIIQTQCDLLQHHHSGLSVHYPVLLLFQPVCEPKGRSCFPPFISWSKNTCSSFYLLSCDRTVTAAP